MNKDKYPWQVCQDDTVNEEFEKLHEQIVNLIIEFCDSHKIDIDEFRLSADGVSESIPYGCWQPCTDSSFSMYINHRDRKPFIESI